jgi:hypothetical protein
MSDSDLPLLRKINQTPFRDLLRFRISGRLDWKARIATACLAPAAAELITRVVKRTRLFRLEKTAVADELIAHFLDGLAAGNDAANLINQFGDERLAARLIRRAKRRGRPWPWQVWSIGLRGMAVVLATYVVLLIRFCISRPNPSVDYFARLNEPILHVPQNDRAWPLWRQAILACADGAKAGGLTFSAVVLPPTVEKPPWPGVGKWLDEHSAGMELARQAAQKPALGFVLGPGGSAEDPELLYSFRQSPGEPLNHVLLPHLFYLQTMANLLSLDVRRAAERGENAIVEADADSLIGLGCQLRDSDGILITQFDALTDNDLALSRLRFVLLNYPTLLTDDQLIRLAHALSGPRVAADLMTLKTERYYFADLVQRVYTDDGLGNGHVTLAGFRSATSTINSGRNLPEWPAYEAMSTVPILSASRAELTTEYDRLMDQAEANFRLPIRQIDVHNVDSQIFALMASPIDRIRWWILLEMQPGATGDQIACERYLGRRDGVVVGIALELYRRKHGHYPAALSELTPGLLPEIPADRITGNPVKYRLIDGKPVVYSVGADRVDDGGKPPDGNEMKGHFIHYTPASWGLDPKEVPRGDWLLFAPEPADPDE